MQEKFAKLITTSNPDKIIACFKNIYSDAFNVFELQEATNNQGLLATMYFLFYNNDLMKILNIRSYKFVNFAKKIQSSYRNVMYHNATHATDVVQVIKN
jgi:hypothetical protein